MTSEEGPEQLLCHLEEHHYALNNFIYNKEQRIGISDVVFFYSYYKKSINYNYILFSNNDTTTTYRTMAVKTKNYSTVTSDFKFVWMKRYFADMALCSFHFRIKC